MMTEEKQNVRYNPEQEIFVRERRCWVCGARDKKITSHHILPKHLKPIKNFICPVCEDCHEKINANDIPGLLNFAYKIQKMYRNLNKNTWRLIGAIRSKGEKDAKS